MLLESGPPDMRVRSSDQEVSIFQNESLQSYSGVASMMLAIAYCFLGLSSGIALRRPLSSISPFGATASRRVAASADRLEDAPGLQPVLAELKPSRIRSGDYVVHHTYGVGTFKGVHRLGIRKIGPSGELMPDKALKVQFNDGILDLPLGCRSDIKLFKRYEEVGEFEIIKLNAMQSRKTWDNRKARAAKNVIKVAGDLLKIFAERQELSREVCPEDSEGMAKFTLGFEYEPTPDQLRCFTEIEHDMCHRTTPMDRLVCGAYSMLL